MSGWTDAPANTPSDKRTPTQPRLYASRPATSTQRLYQSPRAAAAGCVCAPASPRLVATPGSRGRWEDETPRPSRVALFRFGFVRLVESAPIEPGSRQGAITEPGQRPGLIFLEFIGDNHNHRDHVPNVADALLDTVGDHVRLVLVPRGERGCPYEDARWWRGAVCHEPRLPLEADA